MIRYLAAAAIGTAVLAGQAGAQQAPTDSGHRMHRDMTRQQAQQMADKMFQRLDLNHDGTVTRAEAQQAIAQFGGGDADVSDRATRMMDRVFGGAQSVTQAQAEAVALTRFDRQDLNHDGVVTAAERQQARAQR